MHAAGAVKTGRFINCTQDQMTISVPRLWWPLQGFAVPSLRMRLLLLTLFPAGAMLLEELAPLLLLLLPQCVPFCRPWDILHSQGEHSTRTYCRFLVPCPPCCFHCQVLFSTMYLVSYSLNSPCIHYTWTYSKTQTHSWLCLAILWTKIWTRTVPAAKRPLCWGGWGCRNCETGPSLITARIHSCHKMR